MMVQKAVRDEVSEQFIEDEFFEKGHVGLKIRQVLITILAWIGFFLPFLLVLFPILFWHNWAIVFDVFDLAIRIFKIMDDFLYIALPLILIYLILLTFKNNRRYKKVLQKEITYDEETLEIRKEVVEAFMTERFGDKAFRQSQKFVSIPEEKNLSDTCIRDLYKDSGVDLK